MDPTALAAGIGGAPEMALVGGIWECSRVPEPVRGEGSSQPEVITATGVSPGVVTGRAVVVTDPADLDIDEGDILVSSTTDPSWTPPCSCPAGLVVDSGGPLSHAAVVAR